jgi:hypothetical protein
MNVRQRDMNKYYCPNCKKKVILYVKPDFTSTSIWCGKCGTMVSLKDIPRGLFDMFDGWSYLYSYIYKDINPNLSSDNIPNKYTLKLFHSIGKELTKQLSKYYKCKYNFKKEIKLKITVWNMDNNEEKIYDCDSPKSAVIIAYAESINDFFQEGYKEKYKDKVFRGRWGYKCGKFIALRDYSGQKE